MKRILVLALITSLISSIQAVPADITITTRKACEDVACILATHPGKIALAAGLTGCTIINLQKKGKDSLERDEREWDTTITSQLDSEQNKYTVNGMTQNARQIKRLKQLNKEIDLLKKQLQIKTKSHEDIIKEIQAKQKQYLTVDKSLDEVKRKKQITHIQNLNKIINSFIKVVEDHIQQKTLEDKTEDKLLMTLCYLNHKKQFANDKASYNRTIDAGALLALSAILGYGAYKAYPYMRKWVSAYYK